MVSNVKSTDANLKSNIMPAFLMISGHILRNKKKEFEQTFRLGFSFLSKDCISRSISIDKENEEIYYFFSLWSHEEALNSFMESSDFQLLNGAFYALGENRQSVKGKVIDSL